MDIIDRASFILFWDTRMIETQYWKEKLSCKKKRKRKKSRPQWESNPRPFDPRNTKAKKDHGEESKSEIVRALEANNLANDKPRVPYSCAIEHGCCSKLIHQNLSVPISKFPISLPKQKLCCNNQIHS